MSRAIRPIRIDGDVAYVTLTRGYDAIIDAADVPLVEGFNWSALISNKRKAVYAVRVEAAGGHQKMILMHRLVSCALDGMICDHIDGNGLNNRRSNVRHCTRAHNNLNTSVRRDNAVGLKGVCLDKRVDKWKAEIRRDGVSKFLGYFETAELAHAAYMAAAMRIHGEYARW